MQYCFPPLFTGIWKRQWKSIPLREAQYYYHIFSVSIEMKLVAICGNISVFFISTIKELAALCVPL